MTILWKDAKNILCIRLDYLGDVLMCTPAMRAIKQSGKERRITLLTSHSGAAVAPFIPEVDEVIPYAAPWMKHSGEHDAAVDLRFVEMLRERRFDAAVIFTTYSQSALPAAYMCYLAGIPLRLAHCRENPYRMLTDWVAETEPQENIRHEVRRQLDLVAKVNCTTQDIRLSFHVPQDDVAWAYKRFEEVGIDIRRPWVLMHPGATAESRRYPMRHWAAAARELSTFGYPVAFTGSADEAALIEDIQREAGIKGVSFAGELDLGKLGAVIGLASTMVSNNTGPAHIAAALGTPLVVLYALTNPQHTPWQLDSRVLFHDVPCKFCYKSVCPQGHHACLAEVQPLQVVDAVLHLLQEEEEIRAMPIHIVPKGDPMRV